MRRRAFLIGVVKSLRPGMDLHGGFSRRAESYRLFGPRESGAMWRFNSCKIAIDLVAAHLETGLISASYMAPIRTIAGWLPGVRSAGFECRLGDPTARADFCVRFARYNAEARNELLEALSGPSFPRDVDAHPTWQRVRAFATEWARPDSLLVQWLQAVWLEFDIMDPHAQDHAPSLFIPIRPEAASSGAPARSVDARRYAEVAGEVLAACGLEAGDAVRSNLTRCLDVLARAARFFQFGIWLARPTAAVRVEAVGLSIAEANNAFRSLGCRDLGPGWSDFLDPGDEVAVAFDVAEEIGPTIGVECFLPHNAQSSRPGARPDRSPIWHTGKRLLDGLVERGWCLSTKRDALLAWPGVSRLRQPADGGGEIEHVVRRDFSHLKVVFRPEEAPEAKFYLGYFYSNG